MGAVYWGFKLYFDESIGSREIEKEFVELLAKHTHDGKPPEKVEGKFYEIWLKLPSGTNSANYSLRVAPFELSLWTDMTISGEEVTLLDNIMFAIAKEMEPICACSNIEAHDTVNEGSIYYSDPYFLVLEPPAPGSHVSIEEFLIDERALQKISEIKKVLPNKELLQIIKKYSKEIIIGKHGIGIVKLDCSYQEAYVYPHYFLRKLVRSRGVELEEGYAEKYAKELGIE